VKFAHIAGDGLLDLVNTVSWRLAGDERAERLQTFGDVIDWCTESSLITDGESETLRYLAARNETGAEHERQTIITAREKAYAALFENDPDATNELADLYRSAITTAELIREGDRWQWREQGTGLRMPRDRIVRGLVDFARTADLDRLHQCEDVKCGWVYLDTSPRRNRRWCDTKDCGDRNRARAYYARQKAKGSA
jgi:predicted RNA-binding Zn ribbon-like protein